MSKRTASKRRAPTRARLYTATERAVPLRPLNVGMLPNLLGYNVRRAHMALWRDFNRTVGSSVVRPGIFSMMVLIDENPGIAQIELATQLAIDKATIVGLIRQLQRQGWIDRRNSPTDRRRHELHLTGSGKQQLGALRRAMLEHEQRFLNAFTRKELGEFFDYLRRIQI